MKFFEFCFGFFKEIVILNKGKENEIKFKVSEVDVKLVVCFNGK